jgi:hypothetical protein
MWGGSHMRYAKLKKEWLLRGWTDEPRILLNWINGDCRKMSQELFLTVSACDGRTDFDNIAGFFQKNLLLDRLIKEGIAEEYSLGEGLQPYQQYRKVDNHSENCIIRNCKKSCRISTYRNPAGFLYILVKVYSENMIKI